MQRIRALTSGRTWAKIAIDAVLIALSFMVALAIRFEFVVPMKYIRNFFIALPVIILIFLLFNYLMQLYAMRWKYASFDELMNLSSAAIISTFMVFILAMIIPGARQAIPISVTVIGGVISLFTMAFVRMQYRLFNERTLIRENPARKKVLLVGAGEAGEMVARDMLRHPEYDYQPIGFIDDDPKKGNLMLRGIPVLGKSPDIPKIAERKAVDEIFVTMPAVTGEPLQEIARYCEQTDAEIKILPGFIASMAGEVGVASVRELQLEDLLGRDPVETDIESISAYVKDRVVLVTGAGGSIGSELSRQVCGLEPEKLLLLDSDSTNLFNLELEMKSLKDGCPAEFIVANIRDYPRLESVFKEHKPQVVFHSAALKHVPLMESNPSEAVKTNVLGTKNLAELSIEYAVERFILISTDKAVQPANIMGATKRIAEQLIKSMNNGEGPLFTAVRFGNVLGSRGSVVPIFQKQIEAGGPILVTNPDATRYFMTIEEASQLVIQAGAYTEGGDVFILDMGKPVRVIDLANEMIRLLAKDKDVEIKTIGLRPGEKLNETLLFQTEEMLPTPHPKIGKAIHEIKPTDDFKSILMATIDNAQFENAEETISLLLKLASDAKLK